MSKKTDLPIHEIIIKIMYNADREKPRGLTSNDILWKIDNPEITERYIKDVLGWLIRERKVNFHLDKYSLDRYEFLEQRSKNEDVSNEEVLTIGKDTFYLKRSNTNKVSTLGKVILFIGLSALCLMTYFYNDLIIEQKLSLQENSSFNTIIKKQKRMKKLFISKKDGDNQKTRKEMYSLVYNQNYNNKKLQEEINKLYKTTDSIQKDTQFKLHTIHESSVKNLNKNINFTNNLLKKIMFCNILFLALIIFLFIKK